MVKDTGGQAFPLEFKEVFNPKSLEKEFVGSYGMTLRQWYAGQALIAYMACEKSVKITGLIAKERKENPHEFLANMCFQQADAMIAEGKK